MPPQLKTELAQAILPVVIANLATLDQKQQDYGSANLIKFGTYGVVVRMSDKMERIINLINKKSANNESIGDSFLDLANYALIAYVMHTKKWPGTKTTIDVTQHGAPPIVEAQPLHPSSPYPRHDELDVLGDRGPGFRS